MSDAVLLPVYNEASTVSSVLDAVRARFDGEVLVVDDGSTDGTHAVLSARDDVILIVHPRNMGYGRALAEGFAVAEARRVSRLVTMDCDGQHEPAHIMEFLEALDEGVDIVSGSRYLEGSRAVGEVPEERREVNHTITAEVNRVTGWRLTDAFCGFKAYRLDALKGMEFEEAGYGMPMELWAKAYMASLEIREIAVERIYLEGDRSFGEDLDDPQRRLAYYMRVWNRALGEGG